MAPFNQSQAPHHVYPNSAGTFPNARDFVTNHALFLSSSAASDHFMEKFAEYIIRGAELDSSARDPPSRYLPGTRILYILKRIEFWHVSTSRTEKILWLVDPAGVGKSAIKQTVAVDECNSSLLAALFFSAPSGRNNPRRVMATLVYQLAAK
ncbi:hypothetical protein NP233_g3925 [Leucocoprinus birnbaumii]|uniref:Nephrocystin 3-like N-terminal domain-containing protein n=1 Tax=Leucocoprinus birnbaumii TaxID=56174 RepID=A0AAD5W297_9AGAR|nr:hypothetical protein NP233_g3925 [Leucocoprinus birnbaumii]